MITGSTSALRFAFIACVGCRSDLLYNVVCLQKDGFIFLVVVAAVSCGHAEQLAEFRLAAFDARTAISTSANLRAIAESLTTDHVASLRLRLVAFIIFAARLIDRDRDCNGLRVSTNTCGRGNGVTSR